MTLRPASTGGVLPDCPRPSSILSPPFGSAAFYLKSVAPAHITLPDIFRGFLPFIGIQLLILALILLVPEITTLFL
jgi:TRAP-type mannitol/chloroaromatic compound transport system permease large subunit